MQTDVTQKLQRIISMLAILIGILLLTFMIVVEDEFGAIPLLLILMGAGGFFISKTRIQQP